MDTFLEKIHLEFSTTFDFDNVKRSVLVYFLAFWNHPISFAGKVFEDAVKEKSSTKRDGCRLSPRYGKASLWFKRILSVKDDSKYYSRHYQRLRSVEGLIMRTKRMVKPSKRLLQSVISIQLKIVDSRIAFWRFEVCSFRRLPPVQSGQWHFGRRNKFSSLGEYWVGILKKNIIIWFSLTNSVLKCRHPNFTAEKGFLS